MTQRKNRQKSWTWLALVRRVFRRRGVLWLEAHWAAPAYGGWVLIGLTLFFFGAATNTLAGWLYVISGLLMALLGMAALLPRRSLRRLRAVRQPLSPISVGEMLPLEVTLENPTGQSVTLLQVRDPLPPGLGIPPQTAVAQIPAGGHYQWRYPIQAEQRGIYHWETLQLRTAAPFGLFWSQRSLPLKAKAVVYPTVLPLQSCPLIDALGKGMEGDRRSQATATGLTRALRPYRWGDPTRLIHWRTSARYGELRVRELEEFASGQRLIIALDSGPTWSPAAFEQAVTAAASLYFYGLRQSLSPQLWTAEGGLCQGHVTVLERLAGVQIGTAAIAPPALNGSLIWLTSTPATLSQLPPQSRWLGWSGAAVQNRGRQASGIQAMDPGEYAFSQRSSAPTNLHGFGVIDPHWLTAGLIVDFDRPLQPQLQQRLIRQKG